MKTRIIRADNFTEFISVVSQLERDENIWWHRGTDRRLLLSKTEDYFGSRYVTISKSTENYGEAYFDNERSNFDETAEEFWNKVDCLQEAKGLGRLSIVFDNVQEGKEAVRWARQLFPERTTSVKHDQDHVEAMVADIGSSPSGYFVNFDSGGFPWTYQCIRGGALNVELKNSSVILHARYLGIIASAEVQENSLFKKNDVVFYRHGSNVSVAYIVRPQIPQWYLAKDIFTKKCLLLTELQIDGANVIQGAKT